MRLLALLACVSAPDDAAIEGAFRVLHARIYQVYTLADPSPDRDAIHALLSGSFAGEALTREYIEDYTSLVRMAEAGVRVQVDSVDYDDVMVVDRDDPRGPRIEAEWTVSGQVSHPSHTHTRINHYQALYTLEETADGPRIVETRMKNLSRLATPPPR